MNKETEEQSMIGKLVDLPQEEFEKGLKEQKVNIGTMKNLVINLTGAYYELRTRKDAIVKLVVDGKKEKEEVQEVLNGIYTELIKIENKINHLKARITELMDIKTLN